MAVRKDFVQSREVASRIFQGGVKRAKEIANHLNSELEEAPIDEREGLISFVLEQELLDHFFDTLKNLLRTEDGRRYIELLGTKIAARKSVKGRSESQKYKFLAWALEQHKRNPSLSKNAIAAKYASANPGTSAATLRRYLTSFQSSEGG